MLSRLGQVNHCYLLVSTAQELWVSSVLSDEPQNAPRNVSNASTSHPQNWIAALLGFFIATAFYRAKKLRAKRTH